MKMNELKLVYFSPTGTTRKVVMEVTKNIDLKSISYDLTIHKEKKPLLSFKKDDFALFAIPVYSGRVPKTFLDYFDGLKGDNTPAALVATYGCREYEDALLELKTELTNRGFKIIGAAAFPTEHSIVRSVGLGRPNKADMKIIADYGVQLNRLLKQTDSFDQYDLQVPGNTPYRKYKKTPLVPFANINRCTECGACAKTCPTAAISTKDPKKVNKKQCISCHKCVRNCKQKARQIGDFKMKIATRKLTKICQSDKSADIFLK